MIWSKVWVRSVAKKGRFPQTLCDSFANAFDVSTFQKSEIRKVDPRLSPNMQVYVLSKMIPKTIDISYNARLCVKQILSQAMPVQRTDNVNDSWKLLDTPEREKRIRCAFPGINDLLRHRPTGVDCGLESTSSPPSLGLTACDWWKVCVCHFRAAVPSSSKFSCENQCRAHLI